MSELLRVYLDPAEVGLDGYPLAWHGFRVRSDDGTSERIGAIKDYIRERDGHRCLRCGHPYRKGEHGSGEWSPCDTKCQHLGPARLRQLDRDDDWDETELAYPAGGVLYGHEANIALESQWRILTVHHLNGIKHDCRWWNLVSLCQRCHLTIQGKVYMDRPYAKPHSDWFKPFAAGFYAWKYLDLELTQEETIARLDELLDLELTQEALF